MSQGWKPRSQSAETQRAPRVARVPLVAIVAGIAMLLGTSGVALASGMLVPDGQNLPPLAIKYHRVETTIHDQAASTKVVQVFQNNVDRVLEATYLFPLPKGASIRDFSMIINGKRVSGELLERDKARAIYESIVRRLKDPGLLEYADADLIRARVYPIPARGEQRIELEYSEQLSYDGGVVRYLYPLKTGGGDLRTLEDLTFSVTIDSKSSIKSVVSPTHQVDVSRKGDHAARVSFEERHGSLNEDFLLYYTVSTADIGLNLLTYEGGRGDGYFMMLIAPKVEMPQGQALPKDVTFVVDTSGSMSADGKLRQAQNALLQCLRDLAPADRFNIIRFSTEAEPFRQGLTKAGPAEVKDAVRFVEGFRARGGTNIDEGLRTALAEPGDARRPHIVLFMTDGVPTIGETDIARLLDMFRKARGGETRIFSFGVGFDVNTKLLDTLSSENRGVTRYVKPQEDIEVAVGGLWTRISEPVMSRPVIRVEKTKVYDVYPKELPDLFASDQLVVYGRYQGRGATAIRLAGDVAGERKEMVFEETFGAGRGEDNAFIAALWATRKVGYLLEEIRLHGENPELKEEVITLSKEFGIMTPYTAFLVLPEEEIEGRRQAQATTNGRIDRPERDEESRRRGSVWGGAPAPQAADAAAPPASKAAPTADFKAESGEGAVTASEKLKEMKDARAGLAGAGVKRVAGRAFRYQDGAWVEGTYDGKAKTFDLRYGSDAYFRMLALEPELGKVFALGERVTLLHKGVWLRVGPSGKERMSDDEIRQLFAKH